MALPGNVLDCVALMVAFLTLCQTATATTGVCCVTPNLVHYCPSFCDDCDSLDSYSRNPKRCFRSQAQVVFLPGEHTVTVNSTFEILNVSQLRLTTTPPHHPPATDSPAVEVTCRAPAGFIVANSSNISIHNLRFTACGQDLRFMSYLPVRAALAFFDVENLTISQVTVQNTSGYGIYGLRVTGHSLLTESNFWSSASGNAYFHYTYCPGLQHTLSSTLAIRFCEFANGTVGSLEGETHATGISLRLECTGINVELDNVRLEGNVANSSSISTGGNIAVALYNETRINVNRVTIRNSRIVNGEAFQGGGMYVQIFQKPTENESAKVYWKPVQRVYVYNTSIIGNRAWYMGGGVYVIVHETSVHGRTGLVRFENCTVHENYLDAKSEVTGGVAVHLENHHFPGQIPHYTPQFNITFVNCSFSSSSVPGREPHRVGIGAMFIVQCPSGVVLNNCEFVHNEISAIVAVESNVIFQGNVTIHNNSGINGGGLLLCDKSYMYLDFHTNVTFSENKALQLGGAIFAEDQCLQSKPECFFQLNQIQFVNLNAYLNAINITLRNNSAGEAGSAVYGGLIDHCYFEAFLDAMVYKLRPNETSTAIFKRLFSIYHETTDNSTISSNPIGVCLCNDSTTASSLGKSWDKVNSSPCQVRLQTAKYPGETFNIYAVVVGQRNGIVPGAIRARLLGESGSLGTLEGVQSVRGLSCGTLHYSVYSSEETETVQLEAQQSEQVTSMYMNIPKPVTVHVNLKRCPVGFELVSGETGHPFCGCLSALKGGTMNCKCNITAHTIECSKSVWVGYAQSKTAAENDSTGFIVYHNHCPYDFCLGDPVVLKAHQTAISQDKKCAFNRTGMLCGACPRGLSLVLGSSRCLPCSNYYLLMTLLFALAGILLVLVLTLCNLTVSEGSLNGLIFYANIVQANHATFFPQLTDRVSITMRTLARILSVFVAWINLDLGIEVCFYNGMDAYAKTSLQFAFPVYIWAITGVMILSSRRYSWVSTLLGSNAVKVLATLFLLSYTKLLRSAILAVSPTFVAHVSANGTSRYEKQVWIVDGNVPFMGEKHSVLFAVAIAFSLLTLPYMLSLLFVQFLQRESHLRVLCWVRRLTPLLDAYAGPYRDQYRFWTGFLLLLRLVLFTVFASNVLGDPSINMAAVIIVCFFPLLFVRRIYRRRLLSHLEGFHLINLGVFSMVTVYVHRDGGRQVVLTSISAGAALVSFILVLLYHTHREILQRIRCWREYLQRFESQVQMDDPDLHSSAPLRGEYSTDEYGGETACLLPKK